MQKDSDIEEIAENLENLSQISFFDAGIVSNPEDGNPVTLDQNLYVPRNIDESVYNLVTKIKNKKRSILIIGDAGFGKTSLLWNLFRKYSSNKSTTPIWFIKASSLFAPDSSIKQSLLESSKYYQSKKRKPVLLIDTVDILLHEQIVRERLISLLLNLGKKGCQIVLTCRPQESRQLKVLQFMTIQLAKYDKQELAIAVENHVQRFYENDDSKRKTKHLLRIQELLAHGVSLSTVSHNPLTLRMLFTLYAPEEIPEEINTFQLYKKYWDVRVCNDLRAGEMLAAQSPIEQNLKNTAHAVAIIMLAEGVPEISLDMIKTNIEDLGGNAEELDQLCSRGVLNKSQSQFSITTYRFFHQTFFEHGAAQALLSFGENGLKTIKLYIHKHHDNLFVIPVYEQLLLLSEKKIAREVSYHTDYALSDLLNSTYLTLQNSAVYVYIYIYREQVSKSHKREISSLLTSPNSVSFIIYFLSISANISWDRTEELYDLLTVIWKRNNWKEQEATLHLLERLVQRFPDPVTVFLNKQLNISEILSDTTRMGSLTESLTHISSKLAGKQPDFVWNLFSKLYLESYERMRSRDKHAYITCCLADLSENYDKKTISDRWFNVIPDINDTSIRNTHDYTLSLGHLLAIQYAECHLSVQDCRSSITEKDSRRLQQIKFNAISELFIIDDVNDFQSTWELFIAEKNGYLRWLWVKVVWCRTIEGHTNGCVNVARTNTSDGKLEEKIQDIFHQYAAQIVGDPYVSTTHLKTIALTFQKELSKLSLTDTKVLNLLSSPMLDTIELWLQREYFGEFLISASLAGHESAKKALITLIENCLSYPKAFISALTSTLADRVAFQSQALGLLIHLAVSMNDVTRLLRTLEDYPSKNASDLIQYTEIIHDLALVSLKSTSNNIRSNGYQLLEVMLQKKLNLRLGCSFFKERFSIEKNPLVKSRLCIVFGLFMQQSKYDVNTFVELLLPCTKTQNTELRIKSFKAIAVGLQNYIISYDKYINDFLTEVKREPVHIELLQCMPDLIAPYFETHEVKATEVMHELFELSSTFLGNSGRRNLIHTWEYPLRKIFRNVSDKTIENFISKIPDYNWVMSRLIVLASYEENPKVAIPKLTLLMDNKKVASEIKELIRRYLHYRERILGGGRWDELYRLTIDGVLPESSKYRLLLVSANPPPSNPVNADREFRDIKEGIKLAKYEDNFVIEQVEATRQKDLRRAMLNFDPHILHFSGHGTKKGIILEDENSAAKLLTGNDLASYFKLMPDLKCVILNACDSVSVGEEIVEVVPYVIVTEEQIENQVAIDFSVGFYDALSSGRDIPDAFEVGLSSIEKVCGNLDRVMRLLIKS